ncbi:unnamed protein product [Musa acuminata subsp. malaccensis]|uniref:(wild Malaysian banana) hypothetical protein n=1 Tax=Musa acuminata subsp. malaccensis TaxID=214687 RepID=A0A8D7A9V3_MUSAM|nr:unnamed protein product [Musa acuminata subsp. malaccensis]
MMILISVVDSRCIYPGRCLFYPPDHLLGLLARPLLLLQCPLQASPLFFHGKGTEIGKNSLVAPPPCFIETCCTVDLVALSLPGGFSSAVTSEATRPPRWWRRFPGAVLSHDHRGGDGKERSHRFLCIIRHINRRILPINTDDIPLTNDYLNLIEVLCWFECIYVYLDPGKSREIQDE